jgi:hypothetical protein
VKTRRSTIKQTSLSRALRIAASAEVRVTRIKIDATCKLVLYPDSGAIEAAEQWLTQRESRGAWQD